MKCNRNRLHCQ